MGPVIQTLLGAALAPATRTLYAQVFNNFKSFLRTYYPECNQTPLPATIPNLASYIGYLHKTGYSSKTISTHISALSYHHKIQGLPDLTSSFIIKKNVNWGKKLKSIMSCHKIANYKRHIKQSSERG